MIGCLDHNIKNYAEYITLNQIQLKLFILKLKINMNELRSIEQIFAPPAPHWVGDAFKVHNFFPGNLDMKRMSPFFLLDYGAKMEFTHPLFRQGL